MLTPWRAFPTEVVAASGFKGAAVVAWLTVLVANADGHLGVLRPAAFSKLCGASKEDLDSNIPSLQALGLRRCVTGPPRHGDGEGYLCAPRVRTLGCATEAAAPLAGRRVI